MEKQIGHYRIVAELGRGGMGVVYRAHEESLNRFVALKVLGEHLAEDETYVQRFIREAQSAAKLNHPNIVQIYSIDQHEGKHFFVMEYVAGTSVLRLVRQRGKMEAAEAARVVLQAAAGLAAAHDDGIIHRDIKPANLLVNERGLVKIADFGLALIAGGASRLTATGMFMGTPGYLSPEQCLDKEVDHRTDIYSLGVTLFEMLTGRVPFQADSPLALLRQIIEVEPPDVRTLNPDVDEKLRAILVKMMVKDPDERYADCHELINDLQGYLTDTFGTQAEVEAVASGTAAAVMAGAAARPQVQTAEQHLNATPTMEVPEGAGSQPPSLTPPPPPASAGTEPPPVPAATEPPAIEEEPIEAVTPPPVQGAAASRSSAVPLILVLLAVGLVALAGATAVAWKAGWIGAPDGAGTEVADNQLEGSDIGPAGIETGSTGGLEQVSGADPSADNRPTEVEDSATVSQGDSATGASARGHTTHAGAALGDSTGSTAGSTRSTASVSGTSAASGSSASGGSQGAGQSVQGSAGSSADPASLTTSGSQQPAAQAPPPVVPQPLGEGVAIVGIGEPMLAGEAESFLQEAYRGTRVMVVDERSIVEVDRVLRMSAEPDLGDLMEVVRPHAAVLVLIRAEYLGDRQLRYLGRLDTVYESRLKITLFNLEDGDTLAPSFEEKVEYNQLTVGRKVEALLRPRARRMSPLLWRHQ